MTTPIYDSVIADCPLPALAVDTTFQWVAPVVKRAPKPGQKPVRKRK